MSSHNHDEPESEKEAIKSIRDYWREPRVYQFQSEILEIDKDWVKLDKSYFYPEGGGQQSDRGILKGDNQSVKVVDVQEKGNKIWLNAPKHLFNVGDRVDGLIDGKRRQALSRNHSTQHLISAVFWDSLDCETTRAEIKINESQLEINTTLDAKEIHGVFETVSNLISDNLPIKSLFLSESRLKKSVLRGQIGKQEIYRIVKIGTIDYNACGGTHVDSTAEISEVL